MKKNVKVIASLVRKAKKKLYQGKRDEALDLIKKAVNIDDNNGVLVQVIKVIGKKKLRTDYEEESELDEGLESELEEAITAEGDKDIEADGGKDIEAEGDKDIRADGDKYIKDGSGVLTTPEPEQYYEPESDEDIEAESDRFIRDDGDKYTRDDGDEVLEFEPEEYMEPEPEPIEEIEQPVEEKQERKPSMAPEERLQRLFEASDKEYQNGHQQKAIAYLKKAKQLAPDSQEVQERVELLKTRIKSENLVQIAWKKLESGEEAKAVVLARDAFQMFPEATGLDELLSAIEAGVSSGGAGKPASNLSKPSGPDELSAEEYIAQVRQMVQDNALVAAAELAERAYGIHPHNSLLSEFVDNFRKLGLLE